VVDRVRREEGAGPVESSEGEEAGDSSEEGAAEDVMAGVCQRARCVSTSG